MDTEFQDLWKKLQKSQISADDLKKLNDWSKARGITLLQVAATRGDLAATQALLTLGADPHENITKGDPLLCAALILPMNDENSLKTDKEAVYRLLSSKVEMMSQINASGDTPLHLMAVYGYDQLMQDTLQTPAAALWQICNRLGRYPVHSAILNGQKGCMKWLAKAPGIETLIDFKKRNALHYAARYGDEEMVDTCLASGIAIDTADAQQKTALMLASRQNNADTVKALIKANASVNLTDNDKKCALHYAVEYNTAPVVEQLLKSNEIDVNITDEDSNKPLDLVYLNSLAGQEISKLLIARGATYGKESRCSM